MSRVVEKISASIQITNITIVDVRQPWTKLSTSSPKFPLNGCGQSILTSKGERQIHLRLRSRPLFVGNCLSIYTRLSRVARRTHYSSARVFKSAFSVNDFDESSTCNLSSLKHGTININIKDFERGNPEFCLGDLEHTFLIRMRPN